MWLQMFQKWLCVDTQMHVISLHAQGSVFFFLKAKCVRWNDEKQSISKVATMKIPLTLTTLSDVTFQFPFPI